jgi:hypothetical protein
VVGELDASPSRIEREYIGADPQRDVALAVEVLVADRHPLCGRGACEEVLGHVRPIGRHVRLASHERDRTAVPESAERHDRGCTGRAAPDDDDGLRSLATTRRLGCERRARDAHDIALDDDLVSSERPQRGRAQGLAGAEISRVRHGTTVPHRRPFVERAAVCVHVAPTAW